MKRELTNGKIIVCCEIPMDEKTLKAGLEAAEAVFVEAKVSPYEAAQAAFDQEGAEFSRARLTKKTLAAASAWRKASDEAARAMFGDDGDLNLAYVNLDKDYLDAEIGASEWRTLDDPQLPEDGKPVLARQRGSKKAAQAVFDFDGKWREVGSEREIDPEAWKPQE